MTETETKSRKVEYGILAVQDELPPKPASQGRPSPLMAVVESVIGDPSKNGKATLIAVYDSKTACGAAANVLRQRFGRNASVKGVEFATRKQTVKGENGEILDKHGLWVISLPDKVEEGAHAKHVEAEKKRLAALKVKAEAKANGSSEAKSEAPGPSAKAGGTGGQKGPAKG